VVRPELHQRVRQGLNSDQPVIGRGTRVYSDRETIGYVDHLLVDDSGSITHLILRRGALPFRAVVPMQMVKDVGEKGLYVPASKNQWAEIERYRPRPDADIEDEIASQLAGEDEVDLEGIGVSVIDGMVHLKGLVADLPAKRRAHALAASTEGVVWVQDEILTDGEVQARVTAALLADPRTALSDIGVQVRSGVVTFHGSVDREGTKAAATSIAKAQAGVVAVQNGLELVSS
jgi:osmotically-inducible protein OsmY